MPHLKMMIHVDCFRFSGISAQILAPKVDIDSTPKLLVLFYLRSRASTIVNSIATELENLGHYNRRYTNFNFKSILETRRTSGVYLKPYQISMMKRFFEK